MFYVFKLECRTNVTGQVKWNFMKHTTKLFPLIEDMVKLKTIQTINYQGYLSQCTVKGHKHAGEKRELEIIVKNYKSQDLRPKEVKERSMFAFGSLLEENPESTELYRFSFDSKAR